MHSALATAPSSPHALAALVDRTEIIDALYRFAAGQDLRDRPLFESAFAPDATLDFTGPARRLGAELPVFAGRQQIADVVMGSTAPLRTTHTVTNARVDASGDEATMYALVEAQHVRRDDDRRRLLLKNIYHVELRRSGDAWVITHLRIDNVWMDGEPAVLFPTGEPAGDERPLARDRPDERAAVGG